MNRRLVVGNWKMNGDEKSNATLLDALHSSTVQAEMAVCVPFPYLAQTQTVLQGSAVTWGAQNCSEFSGGAYTGEVSANMVADFGCQWVIVGHSERRHGFGESDDCVAAKVAAVFAAELTPIACIGETREQRDAGETDAMNHRQLAAILTALKGLNTAQRQSLVVAYEPVWAIGSGVAATATEVAEVHEKLHQQLTQTWPEDANAIRLIYGGSVNPSNASELFNLPHVDGGLIGGASLLAADFIAIANA